MAIFWNSEQLSQQNKHLKFIFNLASHYHMQQAFITYATLYILIVLQMGKSLSHFHSWIFEIEGKYLLLQFLWQQRYNHMTWSNPKTTEKAGAIQNLFQESVQFIARDCGSSYVHNGQSQLGEL